MAKRKAARHRTAPKTARKATKSRRPLKRGGPKGGSAKHGSSKHGSSKHGSSKRGSSKHGSSKHAAKAQPRARKAPARRTVTPRSQVTRQEAPAKVPRLDRPRRTLEEVVPTPPSSLDMKRGGSAVRSGRADVEHSKVEHQGMSPSITGGDVDVDVEDAYFTGDEAPGGDNPTPDQEVVDDIGKALGVQYDDSEELRAADKVVERDKHRWELDPASAEDYKERK